MSQAIVVLVHLILPIGSGVAWAMLLRSKWAMAWATIVPWAAYLAFNIYADSHAPDKELMHGTWLFFQFTVGTFVALLAALSAGLTLRARVAP